MITQCDLIVVGAQRKPAVWWTYFNKKRMTIRYVVRAGKAGKGRVMAEARCRWGMIDQAKAMKKIGDRLKQYRFVRDLESEFQ